MPNVTTVTVPSGNAALSAPIASTFVARGAGAPPVAYVPLPGFASGQTGYSGRSYTQDSIITTADGDQYAAWYDHAGALLVGKRTLPSQEWTTYDMSGIAGNPLGLPVSADSHNVVSLGLDSSGRLHVAANMHGSALRYVRASTAGAITSWAAPGMVGTEESSVSYPRFVTQSDGTLLFMFRDGTAGDANLHLNRYTVAGGTWARVGMIADGKTTSESPYESRFVDRDGVLAVAITWRPAGGDFNSNNDVHFIQSTDGGTTWTAVDGTAVTLPLTHANTDALVLDTAATNSGILNQFGLDLDVQGRPHIALFLADGSDRNIHHLYWTGSAWVDQQVTDLGNGFGYDEMPTRPAVACTNSGRTLILTSYPRISGRRGSARLIDVTDGISVDVPITRLDGRDWELTYDASALRNRDELTFMVSQVNADASSPGPEYWDVNNWQYQYVGIVTVDLADLGSVLRRSVPLPGIRTVVTVNTPNNASITTTDAIIPGAGSALTPPDLRGRQTFVRVSARASTTGGTTKVAAFEVQQGGSSRLFGSVPFTGGSTALRSSPWMPMRYGPVLGADSIIQPFASVTPTYTGTVSTAVLEVGVLDLI